VPRHPRGPGREVWGGAAGANRRQCLGKGGRGTRRRQPPHIAQPARAGFSRSGYSERLARGNCARATRPSTRTPRSCGRGPFTLDIGIGPQLADRSARVGILGRDEKSPVRSQGRSGTRRMPVW
jgi:hypothetical protein